MAQVFKPGQLHDALTIQSAGWQGRFASFVLDDYYLLAATRYVEMNPVRAGMVDRPQAYPWSSASAHLAGQDDVLVNPAPLLEIVDN